MKTKRRRYERGEIVRTLKKWRASGQSAREYAERNGLSQTTLYRWRQEYERTPESASSRKGRGTSEKVSLPRLPKERFVEVEVRREEPESPVGGSRFVVEVVGGRRVEVPRGFDGDELRRLLEIVEEAGC